MNNFRNQSRPQLFKATCASCGNTCEVPFRPNGKKPVYCNDCFAKNGGPAAGARPSFERPAYKPAFKPGFKPAYNKPSFSSAPRPDNGLNDVKKQLESLNFKLDQLISTLAKPTVTPVTDKVKPTKASAKKAVTKKKK
jgi:CxxC-x17-CxxC domain-containing protein